MKEIIRVCTDCGKEIGKWQQRCEECKEIRRKAVNYKKTHKWGLHHKMRKNFYASKKWHTIRVAIINRAEGASEISELYIEHCMDIHHINDDWTDNRPENLILCTDAEHRKLHLGTLEIPEDINFEVNEEAWVAALSIPYKPLDQILNQEVSYYEAV